MFSFKLKPVSIKEIGRRLGVSHVLEGGVRKSRQKVRVTARLVEAASGRQVWADHYDTSLDDIFAIQDEIAEEIVTAMDVKLVSGEAARTIRKAIRNPDALEAYYRGWQALFGSAKTDIFESRQYFEETITAAKEAVRNDDEYLDALLILAAAKAASNQMKDAAKVAADVSRVAPDFTLEKFAKTQPYKNPETLQQLLSTLRKTGLQ